MNALELKIQCLESALRTIGELAERATVYRDPLIAWDVAQIARDAVTEQGTLPVIKVSRGIT